MTSPTPSPLCSKAQHKTRHNTQQRHAKCRTENNMLNFSTETTTPQRNDEFTEITLRNKYGEYTVRVLRDDMLIGELFDDVVVPVMLAAGYQRESLDNWLS